MAVKKERVRVSDELVNDPNWVAYQAALKSGQFQNMEAGTYVFFHEGQLVGTGMDRDKLFEELTGKGIGAGFVHQVGVPERVVHMPAPFMLVKD